MLTSMKRISLIAFATLVASVSAAAVASPARAIPFPADYRSWTHVKSTLVGPQAQSAEANRGYHHFYANTKAVEGYRTGTFPDGSVLVDDGIEAVEKDGVTSEGSRRRLAVMMKDSRLFPNAEHWGFEMFPGDAREGTLPEAGQAACLSCHQKAPRDLVYSQMRK